MEQVPAGRMRKAFGGALVGADHGFAKDRDAEQAARENRMMIRCANGAEGARRA